MIIIIIIIIFQFPFVTFFRSFYLFCLYSFAHKSLFLSFNPIDLYIFLSLKLLDQIFSRVDFLVYGDGLTIRIIWRRQNPFFLLLWCNEGTTKGKLNFDNKFS